MKTKLLCGIIAFALTAALGVTMFFQGYTVNAEETASIKSNERFADLTVPSDSQYVEKDWAQTTIDFLEYVFNESNVYTSGGTTKKIARYTDGQNVKSYFKSIGMESEAPDTVWSIPSYIAMGDDVKFGEGITVLGAIMSGALVGMDLTAYTCSDGQTRNFVKYAVEYYQALNGENVVLNGGAGGKTGVTWWYELLPGVLFSVIGTQYESESYYMYDIITESARQWSKAVEGLGGANADFWHTSYNLSTGLAYDNGSWYEPDAAAGMAYILYSAYALNKNLKAEGKETYATDAEMQKFLDYAIYSMNFLEKLDESPFYEVLTFLAPYLAARMNAEQNKNYDVAKMIGWTLDGSSAVRSGWGMITDNWGSSYTMGLMGSLTDGNGYAFTMNTFDAMLGFAPMVKYDTRFASDISKWVLCVSQSAQSFYPENNSFSGTTNNYYGNEVYNGNYQSGNWIKQGSDEASFIAYEGLRRYKKSVVYTSNGTRTTSTDSNYSPYASGDAFTYNWGGETDYGLYGSAHVGLFGSTISYTNVPKIIRTDLNKLDVYSSGEIPFWMYYNPYTVNKEVEITLQNATNKLYDTATKSYVSLTSVGGAKYKFTMTAGQTMILAEIGADEQVVKSGSMYTCNGQFIAQERGSVDLTLYSDASGSAEISSGSSVSGTVYAKVKTQTPSSATVESVTLSFGGQTLYSDTVSPSGLVEIDTSKLKNGVGTFTATLTLSGGSIEKSSISARVLNVVKTPAVEYDSVEDMSKVWNEATENWQTDYSKSDHTSQTSVADGNLKITVMSPKGYGFITSDTFTMDFSRSPILELNVLSVSSQYSIKIYVDDMNGLNNYTGEYLVEDTGSTGELLIDVVETLKNQNRALNFEGAHKVSIKISPVGAQGDNLVISDFTVYHMYKTPVLSEPDSYEWTKEFTGVWMSLWSGSAIEGGVNEALSEYTDNGTVAVSASDAAQAYSGIASPFIQVDLGQNPVVNLKLNSLDGKYFVGVKFEGNDKLYIVADNLTSLVNEIEIVKRLNTLYPDDTFGGSASMRVILGVKYDGTAEFITMETYYKLTSWGTEIKNELWLDWERCTDTTAVAELALDSSDRAVITNTHSGSSDTVTAGMKGKFTMNFDYNPELTVNVRAVRGMWRITLSSFDGSGKKIIVSDWNSARGEFTFNLREAVGDEYVGKQNVYLAIELLSSNSYVTVKSLETFYTAIVPDFNSGESFGADIATWNKDETAPSDISVSGNVVTISESTAYSKGLTTPQISVNPTENPFIVIDISSLSDGAKWYVTATVGGKSYELSSVGERSNSGKFYIDVMSRLAASGYSASDIFGAEFEFGGEGDGFSVSISEITFIYKLSAAEELVFDKASDTVSWNTVLGAETYAIEVVDSNGESVWSGTEDSTSFELSALNLDEGVYYFKVSAQADKKLSSETVRKAFAQGNIESVTLSAPENMTISGTTIVWDEIDNAVEYSYKLIDADSSALLNSGSLTEAKLDLVAAGLTAFNYRLEVTAIGDGAVYLDSAKTSFEFYTDIIENYSAKKISAMTANDNQAAATYNGGADTTTISIPYTNWGSVVSLETSLNFDNSPVLFVRFVPETLGGYYFKILVDGTAYYLTDNTFTVHNITKQYDLYLDINAILSSRSDGPSTAFVGTHNVKILFGATADSAELNLDSPSVTISFARLYEMKTGSGEAKFGTLSEPQVKVENQIIKWNAVENATGYSVIVSNEYGVLISTVVSGTQYDCSAIKRAGEYSVMVTASADKYFSSEAGSASFTVTEGGSSDSESVSESTKKGCKNATAFAAIIVLTGAATAALIKKKRVK